MIVDISKVTYTPPKTEKATQKHLNKLHKAIS